jgi:hypothetical protein
MTDGVGSIRVTEVGTSLDNDASLGELVASATQNLSALVRQEIALAKAEMAADAKAAGIGAGMFGTAAFLGHLALIFLSIAAAFGISALGVPLGWAFLIVAVAYLLLAGVLALIGKKSFGRISPPARTIATVKDDIAWAKHPTVRPDRVS